MRLQLIMLLVALAALLGCVDDEPAPRVPITGGAPNGTVRGGGGGGDDDPDGGSPDAAVEDGGSPSMSPDCVAITPGGANDIVVSPPLFGFTPAFAFAAFAPDQCVSGAPLLQIGITNGPCATNPDSGLWLRIYEGSIGDTVVAAGPGVNTDGLVFIDFHDGLGNHWCNSEPTFANNIIFDHIGVGTGDRIATSIFEIPSLPRCGGVGGPEEISVSIPSGLLDVNLTASFSESCL